MPGIRRDALSWLVVGFGCAVAAIGTWQLLRRLQSDAVTSDPPRAVTFARDVAPIVFGKCSTCHHPGDVAPFSLLTFDDVRNRARQIVEVTESRFMPPWLPAEGHGDFAGERRLSADELQTLRLWADSGMPEGDLAELPAAPKFAVGWQSGQPDLVLETPPYELQSRDRDVFRNFVIPIQWTSPRWIRSIEIHPVNPRVTHHARLGVDRSNESIRRDAEDAAPGYAGMAWGQDPDGQLVVWAPGMIADPGLPGSGWRLFPGSTLVLHTHMQPAGKPETVQFRIGIHFAGEPPRLQPAILRIGSCNIDIPAGVRQHSVIDHYVLPVAVDVHSIFPHAHSLCRQVRVVAQRPDGSTEQMLAIERFDENWHDSYRYRNPVRLPGGTRLISKFVYDNSDANPRNRSHPARRVVYGSNAGDEMGDVYLRVTPVRPDQRTALLDDYKQFELKAQAVGHLKTLELDPLNPWSLEALAASYVGIGEPGKAVAILERRLATGPKAVFPVVSLGMAHLLNSKAAEAEKHLRQAVAMDPKYPLAWFGLGKVLAVRKELDPAEKAFRRAAELAPGFLDSRLGLADILVQRGQLDAAGALCRSTLDDAPDASAICLKLAEIAALNRNYDESLSYCQRAHRLAPYTHPAKVLLAVFCTANGDADRGMKLLQEARHEAPEHPMPPLMLGQLARRQKQSKAARECLTAATLLPLPDNWPETHKQRFLVLLHSERFQVAQQLRDTELARDALTQWIRAEPGNARLQAMLDQLPPSPVR